VRANSLIIPAILLAGPLHAQQSLESVYRTTGAKVVAAFEPQRLILQKSSAVMLDGRREIACGVIISSDGHILTKASEIAAVENLGVIVDRTTYRNAEIIATDPQWDVALVRIDAAGLIPVDYAPTSDVERGTWVVANGATSRTARRLLPGTISARIREVPAAGGAVLGVVLNTKSDVLEIEEVGEGGGAEEAGLMKGDVIVAIDGEKVAKPEDVAELLKDRKAGTKVKVTYRRNKKEATLDVRLSARGELFNEQMSRNDQMSGEFSQRRSGFPRVMQHDILGSRSVVGGPLLDLEGRCIGMNIARANRAESFAIPVEDLRDIAQRLMKKAGAGG
jgi:serine protease Do